MFLVAMNLWDLLNFTIIMFTICFQFKVYQIEFFNTEFFNTSGVDKGYIIGQK